MQTLYRKVSRVKWVVHKKEIQKKVIGLTPGIQIDQQSIQKVVHMLIGGITPKAKEVQEENQAQFQLNKRNMEDFKKEIWERDNLHLEYNSLNHIQTQQILHEVAKVCNISVDSIDNSFIFIKMLQTLNKEPFSLDINEKDGFKNLQSFFKLDIHQDSFIYVIWDYDSIDKIRMSVLINYWDYIWYGASDEACLLYYPNTKLLIMITDYGVIKSNFKWF